MDINSFYCNKIIIITGGEGGIGKVLTNAYAGLGATVISADLQDCAGTTNNRIHFFRTDISKSEDVKRLFKHVLENFGKPHILINNGAIAHFNKSIDSITDEEFLKVIEVNLCGSFYCSRAFAEANNGESYGRIINIASTRWNQNEAGWDAYGASKGGLVALTSSMAVSLSATPITVNAISPGWIETGNYDALSASDHIQHPSGRVGKPQDIANAAIFLCNPENDFINGENLVIDGGMTKRMIYF